MRERNTDSCSNGTARLRKLIIQIPCYNEEETLASTLSDLPRELPNVDKIEWLLIDDGSTDRSVEVATENGVDHIIRLPRNQGLARAFSAGLEECIRLDADVIVNTDADNQYNAEDIPKLIEPIINDEASIVIGARPISQIKQFSFVRKFLHHLGSFVVKILSRIKVPDAASGFRAYSREAALSINVFSSYTYTLETLIQAGQKKIKVVSVPIRVNEVTRPSRLISSVPSYLIRSISTIIRIFMTYKPFRFFAVPGFIIFVLGLLLGTRFLFLFSLGQGAGHVQSLILMAVLLLTGFILILVALLADLISVNRKLLEEIQLRARIHELSKNQESESESQDYKNSN